jgi:hypothetical protein
VIGVAPASLPAVLFFLLVSSGCERMGPCQLIGQEERSIRVNRNDHPDLFDACLYKADCMPLCQRLVRTTVDGVVSGAMTCLPRRTDGGAVILQSSDAGTSDMELVVNVGMWANCVR